jgi:GntR family transcriptional regulator
MRKKILFKDEEISKEIESYIENEGLKEGAKLPSERAIAEYFCVQRDTVRNALEILLNKGVVVKKPRRGYYLAPARVEFDLNNFRSVKQAIERIGRESKAKLLSFETISMDSKLAGKTLLPEGTLCYRLARLRYENDRIMSLERSYLIAENVPGFSREDVELKSLSSVLKHKYGINLANSHQRLTQVYATNMEAELLRVRKDEPLMRYEGLVYDRKGRLIEFFDNVLMIGSIEFRIREYV